MCGATGCVVVCWGELGRLKIDFTGRLITGLLLWGLAAGRLATPPPSGAASLNDELPIPVGRYDLPLRIKWGQQGSS